MKYKNSTKGFILKKNFYKDTSVFLEIFSWDFGKKSFFIKNYKKSKNINPAFLSIGSEISLYFSQKLAVPNISEISFIDGFENLDEEKLKNLTFFLQFISKFFQEDEKILEVYVFLKKFFYTLKNFPEKFSILKIFFEIKILSYLGFLADLNLYGDSQEKIILSGKNYFDKEKNFFTEEKNLENFFLEDSSVKFLFFLQKNEVENILNIHLKKSEELKISSIFDNFLKENGFKNILTETKIF